jgi:cytochrome P450
MNFAVRYLLQYPEVQAKLRAEIDGVLGRGRWVTLSDRPRYRVKFTKKKGVFVKY